MSSLKKGACYRPKCARCLELSASCTCDWACGRSLDLLSVTIARDKKAVCEREKLKPHDWIEYVISTKFSYFDIKF